LLLCFLLLRHLPSSPLFPYTTLFRSPTLSSLTVTATERVAPGAISAIGCVSFSFVEPSTLSETCRLRTVSFPLLRTSTANPARSDRKSTRLNSSHQIISYAVFCLKQK